MDCSDLRKTIRRVEIMRILSTRKILKNMFGLLVATFVYCILTACVNAADGQQIEVYVDEQSIDFSISATLKGGTTLVQLRPLFEALDIELTWDNDTRTVIGEKGTDSFTLVIGESMAKVNDEDVSLLLPATIEKGGHTMIPIRFVGEATGAAVGWHGKSRTITVYSREYMHITGLTHDEAEALANTGSPLQSDESDDSYIGFYARGYADLLGVYGCRGMCWDYYIFVDDSHLLTRPPEVPLDQIDCNEIECLPYEIKDGQLTINNDKQYPIEKLPEGHIKVNGHLFTKHEPLKRHRLNGKYDATSYVGGLLGGGFATSSTFIFRPNGTFLDDSSFYHMTDGSDFGDGSGVSTTVTSQSEYSGRYTIINHSILLEYHDGTVETLLFFRPDLNDNMIKIAGRDLLLDEHFDPDAPLPLAPEESESDEVESSNEPFQDLLTLERIAEKNIIAHSLPRDIGQSQGVFITFDGYQWAELDIASDQRERFTGFGDGIIVSLTVKYTIENYSQHEIDLTTLDIAIWETQGYVSENKELAPTSIEALADGESVERMAVILFPKHVVEGFGPLELVFDGLQTSVGEDLFQEISFDLDHPF